MAGNFKSAFRGSISTVMCVITGRKKKIEIHSVLSPLKYVAIAFCIPQNQSVSTYITRITRIKNRK